MTILTPPSVACCLARIKLRGSTPPVTLKAAVVAGANIWRVDFVPSFPRAVSVEQAREAISGAISMSVAFSRTLISPMFPLQKAAVLSLLRRTATWQRRPRVNGAARGVAAQCAVWKALSASTALPARAIITTMSIQMAIFDNGQGGSGQALRLVTARKQTAG